MIIFIQKRQRILAPVSSRFQRLIGGGAAGLENGGDVTRRTRLVVNKQQLDRVCMAGRSLPERREISIESPHLGPICGSNCGGAGRG